MNSMKSGNFEFLKFCWKLMNVRVCWYKWKSYLGYGIIVKLEKENDHNKAFKKKMYLEMYGQLLKKKNIFTVFLSKSKFRAFKTEKYQPKEGDKKKILADRPMFWHLKGNTTSFFYRPNGCQHSLKPIC